MHQYLYARFRFVEVRDDGVPDRVGRPWPVVAGDGQQVGIAKQRNEWFQTNILKDLCAGSFKKKEGGQRDRPRRTQGVGAEVRRTSALRDGYVHGRNDLRKNGRDAARDGRKRCYASDGHKTGQKCVLDEILTLGIVPKSELPDFDE